MRQTKTVSAFKMKKSPVPLIAPKYSFTGHDWWTPLTIAWRKMHALDAFVNSDYLIPTLSKDGLGLIPRPSSPDRALRWLKAALGRRGLQSHQVDKLSWHSFRVFIPDCAFPTSNSSRSATILGQLDHRVDRRHLHQRETQCGHPSLGGSGPQTPLTESGWSEIGPGGPRPP